MQAFSVLNQSIAKQKSSIIEQYIPLWISDGITNATLTNIQTYKAIQNGSSSFTALTGLSTPNRLFTLSSNYDINQDYALEVAMKTNVSIGYACLYDLTTLTSPVQIADSIVTTTATSVTVVRSGKFKLTPGHIYGVCLCCSLTQSSTLNLTSAELIVFGK